MLTFVEETCLLLLDGKSGQLRPIHQSIVECAFVGAVLMDLAFAYRIDTDPRTPTVGDSSPTGDAMLDRILARIVEDPETRDTATWVKMLAADEARAIQDGVLARLVDSGILERQEKRSVGIRKVRYRTRDREAVREVKERMKALVLSDEIPDPREVALLSLVDAANILPDVFPDGEIQGAGVRIKQLRKLDMLGRDVAAAVAEFERAIVHARAHGAY